jgi:hypothetical protein
MSVSNKPPLGLVQNVAASVRPCRAKTCEENASAPRSRHKFVYDIWQQSPKTSGSIVWETSDESSSASTRGYRSGGFR